MCNDSQTTLKFNAEALPRSIPSYFDPQSHIYYQSYVSDSNNIYASRFFQAQGISMECIVIFHTRYKCDYEAYHMKLSNLSYGTNPGADRIKINLLCV